MNNKKLRLNNHTCATKKDVQFSEYLKAAKIRVASKFLVLEISSPGVHLALTIAESSHFEPIARLRYEIGDCYEEVVHEIIQLTRDCIDYDPAINPHSLN